MPPLPLSGERCQPRFTASRQPFAHGSRFNTGRRAAVGLDSVNARDADAHGSGLPSACAICRQWLRDSASAGSRTIAALRPSTRRAVLETFALVNVEDT